MHNTALKSSRLLSSMCMQHCWSLLYTISHYSCAIVFEISYVHRAYFYFSSNVAWGIYQITAVTEIYIKYTGKAISDKTLIRLKFGSKPFVDNELYKIHCNLSYLGGIPSQYIYMCMQQKSVRSRRNCPPYLKKC